MSITDKTEIMNCEQLLESNIQPHGGYFQAPDFIFDLGLEPYELLVFMNLIRRANKSGVCFPSLARICKDTGIKSQNTASKAIKGLISKKLVSLLPSEQGCVNRYKVSPIIHKTIKFAGKNNCKKKQELTPSFHEGVTPSNDAHIPPHQMSTKENKKENKSFKENNETPVIEKEISSKGIGNSNKALSTSTLKYKYQKHEKQILKKLGVNPKKMFNNSSDISKLDTICKENADGQLEHMRKMNLRDKPEIYKSE